MLVLSATRLFSAGEIPEPSGWVNDFAGVIDADYRDKIDRLVRELEEKTSTEISVAAIDTIAPYDEKEYARMLFDKWKPGKKGKDNGVLVLLAVKERRWRIETGYGVEGILPDGLCGEIGRNHMVPYFKEGRYGEGLYYGTAALAKVITQNAKTDISGLTEMRIKECKYAQGPPVFAYVFIPLFFFVWNLPWPFYIGLPFTLLFAWAFSQGSPVIACLIIAGYLASLAVRYLYWRNIPPEKRKSFFGPQSYGGTWSSGSYGGSFGGGGLGGGGFGGGSSGGGGAGGGF
jgi:uncharacterized protein